MSKKKFNLLCVAHPDDETIFFGGLLQQKQIEAVDSCPWTVVCTTSDGDDERRKQFLRACEVLGVAEARWYAYPDRYDKRLDVESLAQRLRADFPEKPEMIFTHGIVGEYGHPHHQDVSYAVHHAFAGHEKLYSVAYNSFPEIEVRLSPRDFETKARILTKIYGSETNRFLNVLPSTFVEGFRRLELEEVEAVYDFLARRAPLRVERLQAHRWLEDYLPRLRDLERPF